MFLTKKEQSFWSEIYYSPAFPLISVGAAMFGMGLLYKGIGAFG